MEIWKKLWVGVFSEHIVFSSLGRQYNKWGNVLVFGFNYHFKISQ